ncbi:hypothetical protein DFP93_10169 [Aneurinibacillus soli]|uniref:Uncharacterized protein n=1 Tax=Aneurinibacillus soli TaxID=1500254 RepID=A0A0U5AW74_9BACL|nr:hypothetical protein [Aneurinibacillus soli]PYE64045.1 hypothetical protein DFP93_10169 [Aneurinibacillus soli]BAU27994.1 hypothetical protein CB4_02168 [Aneurinibacillus soli]
MQIQCQKIGFMVGGITKFGGGAEKEEASHLVTLGKDVETGRSRGPANSPTKEEAGMFLDEVLWAKARSPAPFRWVVA